MYQSPDPKLESLRGKLDEMAVHISRIHEKKGHGGAHAVGQPSTLSTVREHPAPGAGTLRDFFARLLRGGN